jgi:hypothetical protein
MAENIRRRAVADSQVVISDRTLSVPSQQAPPQRVDFDLVSQMVVMRFHDPSRSSSIPVNGSASGDSFLPGSMGDQGRITSKTNLKQGECLSRSGRARG